MTTDIQNVTVNADYFGPGQGIYVIRTDGGYSTLGFDNCLDRVERYALNLYMDVDRVEELMREMRAQRGTLAVYEKYRELASALIERAEATGEQSVAELSPQLTGLEGCRVEVVRANQDRETTRFIVGKSTGPIPCHLEISRRNAHGGMAADREYESVKVLERPQ